MESDVVKMAFEAGGIWSVLFVVLLFYVLRVQEKRDKKYEEREDKLLSALDQAQKNNQQLAMAVDKLSEDVDEIKYTLKSRKRLIGDE